MKDATQAARARLVEALESLRAILTRLEPPVPVRPKGQRGYQVGYDEPAVWQALSTVLTAGGGWWNDHQHYLNVFLDIQDTLRVLKELPVPRDILRRLAEFIEDLGGKAPKRRAVLMIAEDELILATLADAYPAAVKQPDLEGLTGLSHQQISGRLKWLESKRYVKRPEGTKRKGHAITAAGLSAIGRPVEASALIGRYSTLRLGCP